MGKRGRQPEDLTGQRFGRLVVQGFAGHDSSRRTRWSCLCDCGKTKIIGARHLKYEIKSCGCLRDEASHKNVKKAQESRGRLEHGHKQGGVTTPTYNTWRNMRRRCNEPNNIRYQWYGAKGIRVCERWGSFTTFLKDMGARPEGHTISRKDHDGNYEPSNCEWAPAGTH